MRWQMFKQPLVWLVVATGTLVAFTATAILQRKSGHLFEHTRDFPEIVHLVEQAYVDEVDMVHMMPGAYQGVLSSIDENASYIPPGLDPDSHEEQVYLKSGMVLFKNNSYAYALAVETNSPAFLAGIRRGSYLYKIEGQSTRQMSLHQIQRSFTEREKEITLTVMLPDQSEETSITLRFGPFEPSKLCYSQPEAGISLIAIPCFYEGLAHDLKNALAKVHGGKLLLDLRNNARGGDDDLRLLASFFLPKGKLAAWTDADHNRTAVLNPKAGTFQGSSLFILLGPSTSFAAEAFCAIAQERGSARILGRASLGYPSQYETFALKVGGHIQLPTRSMTLNSGQSLTRKGIVPDNKIEIKEFEETDLMLERVLEIVAGDALEKAG